MTGEAASGTENLAFVVFCRYVQEAIDSTKSSSPKDMGKVMGAVMKVCDAALRFFVVGTLK